MIGPFPIVNLDPMHGAKSKKENNAWPKCTVIFISPVKQVR